MKIGISGSSGNVGRATVDELVVRLGKNHSIVAISRTPGTSGNLEGRYADYDDPRSLDAAYSGLDRLVIIPSGELTPAIRSRQLVFAIDAAARKGVRRIAFLSAAGIRRLPASHFLQPFFMAEQKLMHGPSAWSILRMNYFAEALVDEARAVLGGSIAGLGGRVAFVSRKDVAAALAGLIAEDGHDGAIYSATGPQALTGEESAAMVAQAAGKALGYEIVPEERLYSVMISAGLPQQLAQVMVGMRQRFAEGAYDIVTGDVARLAGRAPKSLAAIAHATFVGGAAQA